MRKELHDALENCLNLIHSGVDPEQALSLYPDLSDELREAVLTAAVLRKPPEFGPSQQAVRNSRKMILTQMQGQQPRRHRAVFQWPRLRPAWALGLVISVLAASSVITASAQALPGSALYPLKRSMERLRYALTLSEQSLVELEADLRHERIDEAQALIAGGLQSAVSLQGQVDQINGALIFVDGLPIQITPDWEDLGNLLPGDWVSVEGRIEGGVVVAATAEYIPATWTGLIESMGASIWVIDGRSIRINSSTAGSQSLQVGDLVSVEVVPDIQGQWQAVSLIPLEGQTMADALADLAQEENLRVAEWTGQIVSIHPTWIQIGSVSVRTGQWTELDSGLQPGDWVTVEARWDGDWWALEIKTIDDQDFDVRTYQEILEEDDEDELQEEELEDEESDDEEESREEESEEEEEEHEEEEDD